MLKKKNSKILLNLLSSSVKIVRQRLNVKKYKWSQSRV